MNSELLVSWQDCDYLFVNSGLLDNSIATFAAIQPTKEDGDLAPIWMWGCLLWKHLQWFASRVLL
jgi:hypothetical protein